MRVTGHAGGCLAGDEEFGELGMAFVKFDIVSGQFANKLERFLVVFVFVSSETDQQFDIPRLGDQFPFPFGIGKVVELLRLIFFFHQVRIP